MDWLINKATGIILMFLGILILLMSVSNGMKQEQINIFLVVLFTGMFLTGVGFIKLGVKFFKTEK